MPQPQTIIRFVTIRNPRKPTKDELETGFAKYDPAIHAPLVETVIAAQDQGADAVRAAIAGFIRSDAYIRTTDDLEAKYGKLVEWGDWLMRTGGALTSFALKARMQATPILGGIEDEKALWDNLIAYTFGGGVSEVREGVINALRALNLERVRPALLDDDAAVKRLATVTVMLPSNAAIPAVPEKEPEPEDKPDPIVALREKMRAAWKKIDEHEQAYQELRSHYQAELQHHRAEPSMKPPVPRASSDPKCASDYPDDGAGTPDVYVGRLDAKTCCAFSKTTQKVLSQLTLGEDASVPYVMEKIQESARTIGASVAQDPTLLRSVVQVGGAFWMAEPQPHSHVTEPQRPGPLGRVDIEYHKFFSYPFDPDQLTVTIPRCQIKPLGMADYRRVEQELHCYEPGEVAHIENVLRGETKERVTRHLRRTEETLTTVTEEERTQEKDTQTTDRFELEKQTEKVIQEDIKFDIGLNVQAQYGPVKITADTNFAYAQSTKESDKAASKFAKEVTDRALERVVKKVREEQVRKVLDEFEETNTHKLEGGDAHTVGLYRWVNKVYKARVVNYDKRLILEFMIPEPGAFHLFAMTTEPVESTVRIEKPIDPRSNEATTAYGVSAPLRDATYINESNYTLWGAIYGAKLEPPPPTTLTIAKAYHREGMDHTIQFADSKSDLKVPDGYEAAAFFSTYGLHSENHDGGPNWITIVIGRHSQYTTSGGSFNHPLDSEDDFVPVVLMGRTRMYAVNIEVNCIRTANHLRTWQIKTFDAILQAYQTRQAAYEVAFAEAKARVGVEIRGTNPLRNREIEALELKKGAIRLMTKCMPVSSNAMKDPAPDDPCGVPEFECCEAIRDGSFVQFVEQAFDWSLITYLFYPYFWGRKCNWKKIYQLDDVDTLFLNFLQAGFARVQVPVRLNYEESVMRFLADGTIWNGGSAPGTDSDLYVSIVNEMKEPVGKIDPEVEPWLIDVPTTLTALQCESGCVPGQGLPCPGAEREVP
jgi:hypothetical protein